MTQSHPLLTIRLALKRLYDHEMAPIMTKHDLTRMELDVILFLGGNPDRDTAAEIVQLNMMTKSHVSKAVDHLAARGLITQRRDEKNRRRIHLTLTDAAQPIFLEAQAASGSIVQLMMNGVSAEENDMLCRIICRISDNVSAVLEE